MGTTTTTTTTTTTQPPTTKPPPPTTTTPLLTTKPPTTTTTKKPPTTMTTTTTTTKTPIVIPDPEILDPIEPIVVFDHQAYKVNLKNSFKNSSGQISVLLHRESSDGTYRRYDATSWIEYSDDEVLYVLPKKGDRGAHNFALKATHSVTKKFKLNMFTVTVNEDVTSYNNFFNVTVEK